MPPDGQVKSPGLGSHCSTCQGGYLVGLAKDDPRLGGGRKKKGFWTQLFVDASTNTDKRSHLGPIM